MTEPMQRVNKIKVDLTEPPRPDNKLFWQVCTEQDKNHIKSFLDGYNPVPEESKRILQHKFIMFPENVQAYLEIGCGLGHRIRVGREKLVTVFGIDDNPKMEIEWVRQGIDFYCQVGDFRALPYGDNSFDWVVFEKPLAYETEEDNLKALQEAKRVGFRNLYIHGLLTERFPRSWWNKAVVYLGIIPVAYGESMDAFYYEGVIPWATK